MKRPSRHVFVQGATLLLLAGCAAVFARQLSSLSQALQKQPSAELIQGLQQQLQRVEHELEGMQPFKGVLKEDFEHARQSLTQRLDAVETASQSVGTLASSQAAMNARVQAAEATLLMLKGNVERHASPAVATDLSSKAKARVTKPAVRKPSPPPFMLLGLESRAGESFLAVLPRELQRLTDVHLLRPGMLFQGWRLAALDSQKAHWIRPDGLAASVAIP